MRKQWSTSPNVRGLPEDYPIDETNAEISPLMFSGVGGSMIIFAGAWPRMLPSDFRVRSLDGVADDWPLTYDELLPYYERNDRDMGVSGMGGDPAYPPGGEDPPLPPLPLGAGGLKVARAHTRLGWHWWPEPNSILSVPVRRPPPVRPARDLPAGLQRGRQGVDRPDPLAEGDRRRRDARSPAPGSAASRRTPKGLATGATWIDRDGDEQFDAREGRRARRERDRARRACCCCPPRPGTPTGWRTAPAWSGSG